MFNEILLALIQAATEFLPISSSGHLALTSNLISRPNLFFFTVLHLASLFAVLIFTRREIKELFKFDEEALIGWRYIILATIPAALVGFFFNEIIESAFSSYRVIGASLVFTGIVLILTKFTKQKHHIDQKNTFIMGLAQILALLPGVSRSGMTISAGMFQKVRREEAARFSFLMFIPLAIAAFALELKDAYFSIDLLVGFIVCLFASLLFLKLLMKIIKKNKFWIFGVYCIILGILSLIKFYSNVP